MSELKPKRIEIIEASKKPGQPTPLPPSTPKLKPIPYHPSNPPSRGRRGGASSSRRPEKRVQKREHAHMSWRTPVIDVDAIPSAPTSVPKAKKPVEKGKKKATKK